MTVRYLPSKYFRNIIEIVRTNYKVPFKISVRRYTEASLVLDTSIVGQAPGGTGQKCEAQTISALGKIMGKFRENFVFFPKFSHFFLTMGELFSHFEGGFFKREKYKMFPKLDHDFSQCVLFKMVTATYRRKKRKLYKLLPKMMEYILGEASS